MTDTTTTCTCERCEAVREEATNNGGCTHAKRVHVDSVGTTKVVTCDNVEGHDGMHTARGDGRGTRVWDSSESV